jgi:predicted alpha/beta-hydrolase family hydrolase
MRAWTARLGELGDVFPFDYPYMLAKRRAPDPLEILIQAHGAAVDRAAQQFPGRETVLIGKSMGGRIGCHLATRRAVARVVCFGYPLRGQGPNGKLRDAVLRELTTPILFIQGTRDPLCPLELLADVRQAMRAPNELHVVEHGNHSLEVSKGELKRSGRTQADVNREILSVIRAFVSSA